MNSMIMMNVLNPPLPMMEMLPVNVPNSMLLSVAMAPHSPTNAKQDVNVRGDASLVPVNLVRFDAVSYILSEYETLYALFLWL